MWGLLTTGVGVLYGWMASGEDKARLLWNAFLFGVVTALVAALLGAALGLPPLPFGSGLQGLTLTVLVLTLAFVVGALLGAPGRAWVRRRGGA